jgi:hypothetical protein
MKLEIGCGTGINRIPEYDVNELTWLQSFGGKDTIAQVFYQQVFKQHKTRQILLLSRINNII